MKTFKQYMRDKGFVKPPVAYFYTFYEMQDVWIHQIREIRLLKKEKRKLELYLKDARATADWWKQRSQAQPPDR